MSSPSSVLIFARVRRIASGASPVPAGKVTRIKPSGRSAAWTASRSLFRQRMPTVSGAPLSDKTPMSVSKPSSAARTASGVTPVAKLPSSSAQRAVPVVSSGMSAHSNGRSDASVLSASAISVLILARRSSFLVTAWSSSRAALYSGVSSKCSTSVQVFGSSRLFVFFAYLCRTASASESAARSRSSILFSVGEPPRASKVPSASLPSASSVSSTQESAQSLATSARKSSRPVSTDSFFILLTATVF